MFVTRHPLPVTRYSLLVTRKPLIKQSETKKSRMKKIAIPLENGVLSAHFGHCQKFAIVEVDSNKIINVQELTPPEHAPGLYPPWLAKYGITDVIAGGMGQKAIAIFNQNNINVFVGAPVKNAEELVSDFIEDKLVLNANYCRPGEHERHENCGN